MEKECNVAFCSESAKIRFINLNTIKLNNMYELLVILQ